MPPKKTVPKMSDRVDALEGQMGEVQATLQSLAVQMQQQSAMLAQQMQQSAAIAQQMQQQNEVLSSLSRQIGQRNTDHVTESVRSVENQPHEESRLSGKKVKLP
ncbi:hypothetical protein A2U01_0057332, partial [Trifolium medium]|nr:hypothetical protein [Trifolium medium]